MVPDAKIFEENLSKRLSRQLDQPEIERLAQLLASLSDKGIEVDDVFPYGIQVPLDAISVRGHLTPAQLGDFANLIPLLPSIKDYRIFPRGIILPDRYRVHLNIQR